MLPFNVHFQSGVPVSEQVIYAVKKALVAGHLRPGDAFPSVRSMSQELRINPNTAQKIVSALEAERILEVHPGKGTFIAQGPATNGEQKKRFMENEVERLVVEAHQCQLDLDEVLKAVERQWKRMSRGTTDKS